MKEEICTISLGDGLADNDYTFYTDGSIKRFYDRNAFDLNVVDCTSPGEIMDYRKKELLDKCPDEHLTKIMTILFSDN